MGVIGIMALVANLVCAIILWRHRDGDANRRSVWICSRNDAIGNLAVVVAALGVFGTGTGWPDIAVAAILASLGITGGYQIIRQALGELRSGKALPELQRDDPSDRDPARGTSNHGWNERRRRGMRDTL